MSWKKKTIELAESNDMKIHHEKIFGCHVAEVYLKDDYMCFREYDGEGIVSLKGVDGYYIRPEWNIAYQYVKLLIEEGLVKVSDVL